MAKHFVNDNNEVVLIYQNESFQNPQSDQYKEIVKAQTPSRPTISDSEIANLKYDGSSLYWEVIEEIR